MTRTLRTAAALALMLGLTACAAITPAPPGPIALGGKHKATLGVMWSDVTKVLPQAMPNVRVLSIDGPLLNRLYVVQGLKPGEGLLKPLTKEKRVPQFQADMSPSEQVEFVAASVGVLGYQRVETSELKPAKFGASEALRIELSAQTESGLALKGSAQVAVAEGKLYMLLYLAPAEHYFQASLPEVESIMKSAS